MMRATAPGRRDERGVSLVLVLVALVVFGLLVPILGQFGSTNGVSGYVLKGQRFDRYAAESGMQGAIAWAQGVRTAGRVNVGCPEVQTGPLNGSSSAFGRSVTVKCQGFRDSGKTQPTETIPEFALMARSGLRDAVDVTDAGSVKTSGAWWSEGGIDVGSGVTVDARNDYVGAKGLCSSGLEAAPLDCRSTAIHPDPAWPVSLPPSVIVDPAVDPDEDAICGSVPANRVVAVDPGLHWQRRFFDVLGDGDCGPVVIWLRPGVHVFDFRFYNASEDVRWRIRRGDVVIIGGQQRGWDPNGAGDQVGAARSAIASEAGACDPTNGVEVALAADFWLRLQASTATSIELCGLAGSGQHLAFAQLTRGTDPTEQTVERTATRVEVDGHGDSFDFQPRSPAPLDAYAARDCVPDDRACDDPGRGVTFGSGSLIGDRATGTVTFTVPNPIPADASAKSIELQLTHREDEGDRGDLDRLRVWIDGLPGGRTCDLQRSDHEIEPSLGRWSTAATDEVTCDLSGLHVPFLSNDLRVNVELDTNARRGDRDPTPRVTLGVDQVSLVGTYTPAGYRTAVRTGRSLQMDGTASARFDGTVYVPDRNIDVDFGDATRTSFRRGVVAGTIDISNLPDAPDFAPFSLPGGGSYADRLVTFAAFLVGDTSDVPLLTARVRFCDFQPESGDPSAATETCDGTAGQPPQVLSWQPTK